MQGKRQYVKKSIAEDMENLRQRREDRKLNQEKRGMTPSEMGKMMDIDYEPILIKSFISIFDNAKVPNIINTAFKI